MEKIFTTKISLQSSNPTFSYPIIRLPRGLKELAGRIANVYLTQIDGVEGFFVALQLDNLDKLDKLDKFAENKKSEESPILTSAHQTDAKKERPSRDLNPSRSLDRAVCPVVHSDWREPSVWRVDKDRVGCDGDAHRLAN
jgi:hypothetical protein